jgi:adsorption protein B
MVSRYTSNAFVPSAGTGFVLSKRTLDMFGDEDVLPKDSLTEDYRLSLTLYQKGISMYYVLERVPRINRDGKLVWDFITTRSIFPSTFKTAVKQKTRWILGITMQSFRFKDIFKMEGIRLSGRYSLYKDLKAKVGNMLVMVGYPVLIYFFVSLFIPLDPIYPKGTLSWYFCLIVTIMMIERQIFRSVAIYNVYGLRSVFFACFFPPLLPIRLVWGNIINMTATAKAYKQKAFGNDTKKKEKKKNEKVKEKKLAWAKTDHEFIESAVLKNYHRTVGDYLLQRGYIDPEQLQKGLKESKKIIRLLATIF